MGLLSTLGLLLSLSSCAAAASVVTAQQTPKIDSKRNEGVQSLRWRPIWKVRSDNQQSAAKSTPQPGQLEMRVPFEPTAFPSGRHIYLIYELYLTNFGA